MTAEGVARAEARGLSKGEVAERVSRGLVNDVPTGPSRTVADIVRANVVTRFNLLLGALLVLVLFVAPPQDALFGIVLVVNTLIGITQELRAKRTLDRLALLSAPKARVVRGGKIREIAISKVVLDDVLELSQGDQIVVDGEIISASGLEIDESLLTGESDPVIKAPGAEVLSGSFVVAGKGLQHATKVGKEAYAVKLAEEAKQFTLVRSELRRGIDFILGVIGWAIPPTMALLVWSQLEAADGVREALRASVAGAVGMVPQGLVLLTSIAFAVGIVRLGRRNTLVQELPAIEMLARVDVVCFDKTGTLTEGRLVVEDLIELEEGRHPEAAIGALAEVEPAPNATLQAVAAAYPAPDGWPEPNHVVPFSSARRWSGATFDGRGSWILGAADAIAASNAATAKAASIATEGRRVLLLAHSPAGLAGEVIPLDTKPVALITIGDQIRDDAEPTLDFFARQGVDAKVISGDHPATVSAIAARVGLAGAEHAVDASNLSDEPLELARQVKENSVFGRVGPHQKRAMVAALQDAGHVVAMTGDGVNDVLALKDADIGVAMGTGSSASRAVAQLVLLDSSFASLPAVVGEGRRVIANIERVANLFVTKTVYAFLLALAIGVAMLPFPFVPRHLTLVGSVTIGIPAFWLALAPSAKRAATGFIRRVLRFAIPVGALAAAATYAAYELALSEDVGLTQSRTTATLVLAAIGLFALVTVSRPLTTARKWLIGAMAAALFVVFASKSWREFFELELPGATVGLAAVGIIAITGAVMYGALRTLGWAQHVPELIRELPQGAGLKGIRARFRRD